MAMGTGKQRTEQEDSLVRSRNCLRLRATFSRQLEQCQDGERFEEFAGSGAKRSIGAGGLVEPQSYLRGSAREQADRSIGCRTRLDTKPSRGAAVVSACPMPGRPDSG